MFRLTASFLLLVFLSVMVLDVDGWWWGRRRRRRRRTTVVHQHVHHTSTNKCLCLVHHHHYGNVTEIVKEANTTGKLVKGRDVAEAFHLDEDYPGLDRFVEYLNSKRDTFDMEELAGVIRRASQTSTSNSPNGCDCGRALVDRFNMETL